MKKFGTIILIVIFVATLMFALFGCDLIDNYGGNQNSANDSPPLEVSSALLNQKYSATSVSKMGSNITKQADFRDDNYYYYIFYLGKIENVPLQKPAEYEYFRFSGNNYSHSFTTSKANSVTIEEQSSHAASVTEGQFHEAHINAQVETGFGMPLNAAPTKLTVELGYRGGWNKSSSDTWTNSYSKAESFSVTNSKTTSFSFDSSCEQGYYRYILFGTIDVYTIVMFDPSNSTYYIDTITAVAAQGWDLDFSKSSTFDDYEIEKLPFDMSIIETLGYKPDTYYSGNSSDSNPSIPIEKPLKTTFEKSFAGREILITRVDGKEHLDFITCELDIGAIKSAGYTKFSIKVVFDMRERGDGYQDLWILKNHNDNIPKEWTHKRYEHTPGKLNTNWGQYEAYIEVHIDDWSNRFTLKWGAFGNGGNVNDKQWYLGTTKVYVEAIK